MSIDSSIDIVIPVAVDTDGVAGVSSDGNLLIGAGRDHDQGNFWSDLIDDVRIYNRAVRP